MALGPQPRAVEKRAGDLKGTEARSQSKDTADGQSRKACYQRAGAQKGPEPKVTVSKAQSQSTRQDPKKRSTLSKNVQCQHSASALVTSPGAMALPYPSVGSSFGKQPLQLGLGV
ncbi:unnamed protein product [Rangifer tarandus platyrhynchus]|uniref:Uncharacterized protein n=1 Tax=Rangifer tarandus platyrhynchus TaxID=3082113 RepID=A0ABN8ZZP6_RANTA|nr:unnamed protein product [Rangifer tarandus platyrhynchus]